MPRNLITLVSRLRTYHTRAKAHLFEKNIIPSSECDCGSPSQDLNHIFFYYPLHAEDSEKLIIDLYHNGFSPPLSIDEIAFSDNLKAYYTLLQFTLQNLKFLFNYLTKFNNYN